MSQSLPVGRLIRAALGLAVLWFGIHQLRLAWQNPDLQAVTWQFHPGWIALALLLTWLMYAVLISGWRLLLLAAGQDLSWREAARIWTVSSLGALLPGRVWAIAGMAMMAQRVGVHPAVATSSALAMQLLSIASGAAIGLALTGPVAGAFLPGGTTLLPLLAVAALFSTFLLRSQPLLDRLSRLLRLQTPIRAISASALSAGLGFNALAWLGYGASLWALAHGTMPQVALTLPLATGAYALAYLAGYLLLLVPAGLGVREATLAILLAPQIGPLPAAALGVASRIATLINQFGAAAPFLLLRSTERDDT